MIKVHPLAANSAVSSSSSNYVTSRREAFTVWMKSLVMQGNGCTVYNENGEIVYRIDNYDEKCGSEVYLMDLQGNLLFTILRKVYMSKFDLEMKYWISNNLQFPLFIAESMVFQKMDLGGR